MSARLGRWVLAGWLILLALSGIAHAQKQGGVIRIAHRDNPPSASIHEEATISTDMPFMAVFNNLVLFVASANAVGIGPNHYLVPSVPLTGVHLYSQTVFLDETTLGINFISPYQTTNFLR